MKTKKVKIEMSQLEKLLIAGAVVKIIFKRRKYKIFYESDVERWIIEGKYIRTPFVHFFELAAEIHRRLEAEKK